MPSQKLWIGFGLILALVVIVVIIYLATREEAVKEGYQSLVPRKNTILTHNILEPPSLYEQAHNVDHDFNKARDMRLVDQSAQVAEQLTVSPEEEMLRKITN